MFSLKQRLDDINYALNGLNKREESEWKMKMIKILEDEKKNIEKLLE